MWSRGRMKRRKRRLSVVNTVVNGGNTLTTRACNKDLLNVAMVRGQDVTKGSTNPFL